MINSVVTCLENINKWMIENRIEGTLSYRGEISHMVRCGRSQISLNNSEEGQRFSLELQKGKRKISSSFICSLDAQDEFQKIINDQWSKIDLMPEIPHLKPLNKISQGISKHVPDLKISEMNSDVMVKLFKDIDTAFADENVEISGAFSAGEYAYATINTHSDKAVSYQGTDFNIEVVVQLLDYDKKEIRSAQVGESLEQYRPQNLIEELLNLYKIKTSTERVDIPAGEYDVIFSAHAFADLVNYMSYLTFHGEGHLFGSGIVTKDNIQNKDKIFGDNITIIDDPLDEEILFARPIGLNGLKRDTFPLIEQGRIQNLFYTDKETCDRFSVETNNDMYVASFKVQAGEGPAHFAEMVKNTKKKTIYVPYIHYMNITNSAKGEFTGTSRFGTFLIENGEIKNHLFNLRINDSYPRIFNHVEWLGREISHVNTSNTYGARLASSIACPTFVKVNDVKITGSSAKGNG